LEKQGGECVRLDHSSAGHEFGPKKTPFRALCSALPGNSISVRTFVVWDGIDAAADDLNLEAAKWPPIRQ